MNLTTTCIGCALQRDEMTVAELGEIMRDCLRRGDDYALGQLDLVVFDHFEMYSKALQDALEHMREGVRYALH